MYRVLIVDDEPIAVKSVEYMIRNHLDRLEVVGTAGSGRAAVEKSDSLHPDIVIMDINMPGINGLDAMKQIRSENPAVRFIIISAFDYFNYAVEAVALNVDEYLLKPVKEEKLVQTLKKVVRRIDERRDKVKRELELKEKFEMVVPVLETGFISSICMLDGSEEDLQKYCRLFGFERTGGYVLAVQFGETDGGEVQNRIGVGVQSQKFYQNYRDILKNVCVCVVGPLMLNRLIVYVLDEHSPGFEQKLAAVETAQRFLHQAQKLKLGISAGIGGYCPDVRGARESYRQAICALEYLSRLKSEVPILHYEDILEERTGAGDYYTQQLVQAVCARANESDAGGALFAFSNIFDRMCADVMPDFDELKNNCISLIVGFDRKWGNWIRDYPAALGEAAAARTQTELYHICSRFIAGAVNEIASGKKKRANDIIQKADAYMESHYESEVTLGGISREVNLSPYYFSHFYKEETGVNFIDKLIRIRIEKAKHILASTDASVKDATKQVGYADPNYFSKLFKKIVGVTASEYKEHYGK